MISYLLTSVLSAGLLLCSTVSAVPSYDIVIRGGKIVDGCGNPWYYGDVAVEGDRIAAIGDLGSAAGKLVIDASGMVVAPGFIDIHGGVSFDDPLSESKIRQGVTTVIGGAGDPDSTPVAKSFAAYLRTGNSINYGRYCSPPLGRVMGEAVRRPTPEELERIKLEVSRAMADGAIGITFALRYSPESFLTTEDVIAITRVVKQAGGYYNTHMRSESDSLLESIEEVITINKEVGISTNIGHLKVIGPYNWGKSRRAVQLIEQARRSGLQVTADMYPYEWSGTVLDVITPHWAKVGGKLLQHWADPGYRPRIASDIDRLVRRRGGPGAILIASFPAEPALEGKTLYQAAKLRGVTVPEQVMDMVKKGGASCHYHVMNPIDIEHIMVQRWVAIGSDAGVIPPGEGGHSHPRAYGTFPRILDYYVRQRGLLSLEDAIRKMTSLPAQIAGIKDRGRIVPGLRADLVVFDPAAVRDNSTYAHPDRFPDGISWVIVNGTVVLADGRHTGAKPGRPIYGPGKGG